MAMISGGTLRRNRSASSTQPPCWLHLPTSSRPNRNRTPATIHMGRSTAILTQRSISFATLHAYLYIYMYVYMYVCMLVCILKPVVYGCMFMYGSMCLCYSWISWIASSMLRCDHSRSRRRTRGDGWVANSCGSWRRPRKFRRKRSERYKYIQTTNTSTILKKYTRIFTQICTYLHTVVYIFIHTAYSTYIHTHLHSYIHAYNSSMLNYKICRRVFIRYFLFICYLLLYHQVACTIHTQQALVADIMDSQIHYFQRLVESVERAKEKKTWVGNVCIYVFMYVLYVCTCMYVCIQEGV